MASKRNRPPSGRGRKSKVKDDEPVWCICRSSDISRFMIACDKCEEWYHGECINVTAKQAETIKRFFCEKCRRKNSSLEIEYKGKNKSVRKEKKEKKKKRKHGRDMDEEPMPIPAKKSRSSTSVSNNKSSLRKERHLVEREYPPPASGSRKKDSSSRKRGSSSANMSGMLPDDDLDDPDEAMLPPDEDMRDDSATDDELETQGLPPAVSDDEGGGRHGRGRHDDDNMMDPSADDDWPDYEGGGSNKANRRCGQCEACRRVDDCGKCDFCKDMRKFGGPNRMRQKCRLRQCVDLGLTNTISRPRVRHTELYQYGEDLADPYEDAYSPEGHHPGGGHRGKLRKNDYMMLPRGPPSGGRRRQGLSPHRGGPRAPPPQPYGRRSGGTGFTDSDEDSDGKLSDYRQCLGPKCILAARPASSYCSDECAVKMATNSRSVSGNSYQSSRSLSKWQHHSGGLKEVVFVPYNLSYPDHLYCKHHRYYNWHDQGVGLPDQVSAAQVPAQLHQVQVQPDAVSAMMALPDEPHEEYYTINESDNLEINWPQETVATAATAVN